MLLSHEILKRLWLLQIVQKKLISFKEEAHHQQSHIIKFRLFVCLFIYFLEEDAKRKINRIT